MDAGIPVECVIEQNSSKVHVECNVYSPTDDFPYVDNLIVTPMYFYGVISEKMKKKNIGKIWSLSEILDKCLVDNRKIEV